MRATVSILGDLEVRVTDRVVGLTSRKQRELVALLALCEGHARSVDSLIEDLWGHDPPATARKNIQVLVGRIRAAIGAADLIPLEGAGYALDSRSWTFEHVVFAHELRHAQRLAEDHDWLQVCSVLDVALERWSGPGLGSMSNERWAVEAGRTLDEARREARLLRAEAWIHAGKAEDALVEIRQLCAERKEDLNVRVLLVRALFGAGRHVDALDECRSARADADRRTDLAWAEVFRVLEQRVLSHDHDLAGRRGPELPRVPLARHPLVGRGDELAAICDRFVNGRRLTTIVGPGGTGKTRIATAVCGEVADAFDEIAWIDLSPTVSTDDVLATLLNAFGVTSAGDDPIAALIQAIGNRRLGLVLDNLEQVIDCAALVARLRDACSGLHLLGTSRIPLGIEEEEVLQLAPFVLADDHDGATDGIDDLDAVRLFCDRAELVDGIVPRDERTIRDVHGICVFVDGLPLGIELAAARTRLLAPRELLVQLRQSTSVVSSRSVEYPERHRSLHNVIAWSFDLLDAEDQYRFCVLSMFIGGCDVEDFQHVAQLSSLEEAAASLARLAVHSLAVPDSGRDARPRYRMLETIAAFGRSQLDGRRDAAALRLRFAERMLDHVEASNTYLAHAHGSEQRLIEERVNVHASFDWALDNETAVAADLFIGLDRYLHTLGSIFEGDEMGRRILRVSDGFAPRRLALVLGLSGRMAHFRVDPERSTKLLQQGLSVARANQDEVTEVTIWIWYVECLRMQGELEDALRQSSDVRELARASSRPWLEAMSLAQIGFAYMDLGRAPEAMETFRTAQVSFRDLGDQFWVENMQANLLALGMVLTKDPGPLQDLAACADRLASRRYWTYSAHVESFRLRCALEVGEFVDAAACADELIARVRSTGEEILLMFTLACASVAFLECGRVSDARATSWESLVLALRSTQTLFADYSIAMLACTLSPQVPEVAGWVAHAIDRSALDSMYALDQHVATKVDALLSEEVQMDVDEYGDVDLLDKIRVIIERVEELQLVASH